MAVVAVFRQAMLTWFPSEEEEEEEEGRLLARERELPAAERPY